MAKPDRLERLTDLVLVLLAARRPMSLDEIAGEIPGYPDEHGARRQAFERDKRLFRDDGIPVLTEPIGGKDQYGYRIDPDSFYLPDLDLSPEEQAALHLAVAGVHLGEPSGRTALLKLGAAGTIEARPVASVGLDPALPILFDAVRNHSTVAFSYRGESRRAIPTDLAFRGGRWYVGVWDLDRLGGRTFRTDRFDDVPVGLSETEARLPDGFDVRAAIANDPGASDDVVVDAVVEIDHVEAGRVIAEVGEASIDERHRDGGVRVRVGMVSPVSTRSWVLGLLDHAWVLGPPELRDSVRQWLEAIVVADGVAVQAPGPAGEAPGSSGPARPRPATGVDPPGDSTPDQTASRPEPPRPDSAGRLRRLLALVGWLARVGEAPIDDVAERFGISPEELVQELELAACCGTPPYTPDTLMEILVTDGAVRAFLPAELARPRRVTPAEGFALAAAGRTILAVPGADPDGPLARALEKLERVLGTHQSLTVKLDDPALLSVVRLASETGRQLEIEYHSASADEITTRVVDPRRVISVEGHWYMDAFCHRAGDIRRFRVDRIRQSRETGERLAPPGPDHSDSLSGREPGGFEAFVPGPGAVTVELAVRGGAAWLADSVPATTVTSQGPGETLVQLSVGGTAWLERLLLQLGPDARVVDPPEYRSIGADAARRVLRRYEVPDPPR